MDGENTMHHYAIPMGVEHHFHLDFVIEEPEDFHDFFTILRQAGKEDIVFLHINSPGGRVHTCTQIIHAINTTEATVVGCAEGDVASCAAFIFFSCHVFQVAEHSQFLIHNGEGGYVGKPSDTMSHSVAHNALVKSIVKETSGLFLTKRELKDVLKGRELYLSSKSVTNRINKAIERQEEESDAS